MIYYLENKVQDLKKTEKSKNNEIFVDFTQGNILKKRLVLDEITNPKNLLKRYMLKKWLKMKKVYELYR